MTTTHDDRRTYIPLPEAWRLFPDGAQPSHVTLYRWAREGIDGVTLRSARVGRRMFTTRAWVEQFLQELNETDEDRLRREGR